MQITQRSESMNPFFDNYVHSRSMLKEFVEQFDNALRRKPENEKIADFNYFNVVSPIYLSFLLRRNFKNFTPTQSSKNFIRSLIA